jgi:hypothetical protein
MSMADVCDIALEMFLHGSGVIFVRSDDVYNYTRCCCWRWSAGIATQGRTHTIYKKSSILLPIQTSVGFTVIGRYMRELLPISYNFFGIVSSWAHVARWNCPIVTRHAA